MHEWRSGWSCSAASPLGRPPCLPRCRPSQPGSLAPVCAHSARNASNSRRAPGSACSASPHAPVIAGSGVMSPTSSRLPARARENAAKTAGARGAQRRKRHPPGASGAAAQACAAPGPPAIPRTARKGRLNFLYPRHPGHAPCARRLRAALGCALGSARWEGIRAATPFARDFDRLARCCRRCGARACP